MTTVHIPALASMAGETVWEPDHTQQQRDKQDVSLKTLPESDPSYPNNCLVSKKKKTKKKTLQPCHRHCDKKKIPVLCAVIMRTIFHLCFSHVKKDAARTGASYYYDVK